MSSVTASKPAHDKCFIQAPPRSSTKPSTRYFSDASLYLIPSQGYAALRFFLGLDRVDARLFAGSRLVLIVRAGSREHARIGTQHLIVLKSHVVQESLLSPLVGFNESPVVGGAWDDK